MEDKAQPAIRIVRVVGERRLMREDKRGPETKSGKQKGLNIWFGSFHVNLELTEKKKLNKTGP